MYDNILLPVDGSEEMGAVIDHALELAEIHGSTIHTLYVVDTASLSDLPLESSWEGVSQAMESEGKTALEKVERRAGEVPVTTEVVTGSPSRQIGEYAAQNDCDVIVMGTHGRSGFDRWLLGSVAERVVRSSPVPVLTIRVGEQ
jgi:nucleotide-binding universal stress UspA family protein